MFDWLIELIYYLLVGIMGLVDFILDSARVLGGLTPVEIDGESTDIMTHFLMSNTISTAFWLIVMIAIVLLFLATIFMMVRIQYDNPDGSKTPAKVIGKACKAFVMFFLVPIIMVLGLSLVTVVVQQVDLATNPYYEQMVEDPNFVASGRTTIGGQIVVAIGEEAWNDDISEAQKTQIRSNFIQQKEGYNYTKPGDVWDYYNLWDLQYSTGFIVGLVFLVILALAMLQFVERIVNILVLYIIAPFPIAASVIDDGQRFKLWRDQVLVKFLNAYGVLIALNIYTLMIPVIQAMSFHVPLYGATSDAAYAVTDALIKLFIMLGAAIAVKKAPILIGNLISQGAGSQEAADNAHSMGALAAIGGVAAMALRPLGMLAKKGLNSAWNALPSPIQDAKARREKIRGMKNDAKLHDQIKKVQDKDPSKRSRSENNLLNAYEKSRGLNGPNGIGGGSSNGNTGGGNSGEKSPVQQPDANKAQKSQQVQQALQTTKKTDEADK